MKVKPERASEMIAGLRPFALGWLRALFLTIENKGRKAEGFKHDLHSAAACSWMTPSLFVTIGK